MGIISKNRIYTYPA